MIFVVPLFSEANKFKERYQDFEINYGTAHYSWLIIFKKVCRALENASIPFKIITRPEVYSTETAQKLLVDDQNLSSIRVLHIRPIELFRPMPGVFNSCYYLWEFRELPDTWIYESPYYDFKNQLRQMDHIFCANDTFTRQLIKDGFSSVSTLPVPTEFYNQSKL